MSVLASRGRLRLMSAGLSLCVASLLVLSAVGCSEAPEDVPSVRADEAVVAAGSESVESRTPAETGDAEDETREPSEAAATQPATAEVPETQPADEAAATQPTPEGDADEAAITEPAD